MAPCFTFTLSLNLHNTLTPARSSIPTPFLNTHAISTTTTTFTTTASYPCSQPTHSSKPAW